MRVRVLIASVIFLVNFSRIFGLASKPDPDQLVLDELKRAGSNLAKPHIVDFFLYFPTQEVANEVAGILKADGFQVNVQPAAQGPGWLCKTRKTIIPTISELHKIRKKFSILTTERHGEYDGWGAAIVK